MLPFGYTKDSQVDFDGVKAAAGRIRGHDDIGRMKDSRVGSFDGMKAAAGRIRGHDNFGYAFGRYNISRAIGDCPLYYQHADCDKTRDPDDTDHFSRVAYRNTSRENNG